MRISPIIAFVAVAYLGSASIAAQQPPNGLPPKGSSPGSLFAPSSKSPAPPRFLFPTPAPNVRLAPKPTVVCGMTLIPADPNVDRGIRREVPEDGPRFSIRSVDPTLCRQP